MVKNLVAYIRSELVAGWRLHALTYGSGQGPLGYGSNAAVFGNNVGEDSVLWIFTMPTVKLPRIRTPRYYPPSLVARIRVADLITLPMHSPDLFVYSRVGTLLRRHIYVASSKPEGSLFCDFNDATQGVMQLKWRGKPIVEDALTSLVRSPGQTQALRKTIGVRFQSPRRVDDDSVAGLQEVVGTASESTAFISHSHSDGRQPALNLAEELLKHGITPWLDSLVLNPRLESPEDVARSLMHGIDRSSLFVAVVTENYRRLDSGFNWMEAEWRYATGDKERSHSCFQVDQGGRVGEGGDAVFQERDMKSLARVIAGRWDATRV